VMLTSVDISFEVYGIFMYVVLQAQENNLTMTTSYRHDNVVAENGEINHGTVGFMSLAHFRSTSFGSFILLK
jgi:hypothetical protein